MRVLHVNKFLYRRGGAETYVQELARLQELDGHTVAFFAMAHEDNPATAYDAAFPSQLDLDRPLPPARRLAAAGRMIWSGAASRGMAEVVGDFRPDVVHLHNVYHQLSPSVLAPVKRAGVPAVMTLHDYKLACPTYQFLSHGAVCDACVAGSFRPAVTKRCKDGSLAASALLALESTLHRWAGAYAGVAVFVCPSAFLADRMRAAGVFPDRLRVLDHFVDAAGVEAKTDPGGPVVFAGRLSVEKGVDVLIRAIGRLGRDARLEIAGDGPERTGLESLAARVAPGRVHFLGRLGREDVLGVIRSAAVVAVPSRWYENQGLVALEAFACGVPVVASRIGGLPDVIEDGCTGLLVEADDEGSLASALVALLADPARAMGMGGAARAVARTRFAPERHLSRLHELYGSAASPGPVRASTAAGG